MFELYSEKPRRVIFFARKEASEMGDREITPSSPARPAARREGDFFSAQGYAQEHEGTPSSVCQRSFEPGTASH
jgi:hypothetical protein